MFRVGPGRRLRPAHAGSSVQSEESCRIREPFRTPLTRGEIRHRTVRRRLHERLHTADDVAECKGGAALPYDPDGPDRDCGDFESRPVAQRFFEAAGGPAEDPHRLDGDDDGLACESLPGSIPTLYPTPGP